jgi:hypothetical protein
MAFVQLFRATDGVRFSQSPSGGGTGNPAWDFQWFIPNPSVGKRYQLILRAAYLPLPEAGDSATARENLRQRLPKF